VEDPDLRPDRLGADHEQVAAVDRDPAIAGQGLQATDRGTDVSARGRDRDEALARDEVRPAFGFGPRPDPLSQGGADALAIQSAHASLPLVTIDRTASRAPRASAPRPMMASSSPTEAPRPRTAVMLRASARRP